ncbi:MAG: site-specific tyrosine recombinase XerC [Candidatus Aminicenantes bacterium]|nr:site-specific tyrosine recombinase XerC [Candidatus Aminicenantes bacterium]NIQ65521.1 site-specific tyrosine recombinase XerC [Candidatus Aminicenantes bacterium]NIT21521.1 site-specific tyrosine recombinase XerC [Candidatus Aminicenantes bacterium]
MTAKKKNERTGARSREFNELYEYAEFEEQSELEEKQKKYLGWMSMRGYSMETIKSYGHGLSHFINWCHERGILRPGDVTRKLMERYQAHLGRVGKKSTGAKGRGKGKGDKNTGLSTRYQCTILCGLRGFFSWLCKNNHILYNPASELEFPRQEKSLPRDLFSVGEVELILNQVDLSSYFGLRDRAILETFYSTGMRRFELCRLRCKDVYIEGGVVLIREGKAKKDRLIPIGERAAAWIEKYMNDLRPRLLEKLNKDKDDHDHNDIEINRGMLFLSKWGKALYPTSLSRLVNFYIKKSGINKEGSCHLFRHTMATLMLEGGADIRYIQQMLGHSSLESTQIYTRVSIKKLKEVHKKTHPGANLK